MSTFAERRSDHQTAKGRYRTRRLPALAIILLALIWPLSPARASTPAVGDLPSLRLAELLEEVQARSPEAMMYAAGAEAAQHRIPQSTSLADPMVMVGYQNAGFSSFTYPEMSDSQFMLSVSQMLPFPGKRALRGEMTAKEADSLASTTAAVRLRLTETVKLLFYDLFLGYKTIDVLGDKTVLLKRVEEAASARYSTGMGMLQEVAMAQTEKYMVQERQTMTRQGIASVEAMLCGTLGRTECASPLGLPEEPADGSFDLTAAAAAQQAERISPLIAAKEQMVAAARARVAIAEKEYYPDFTVTGTVAKKGPDYEDMWSITTAVNVPIYYQTKQRQGVLEAKAALAQAEHELAAAKAMLLTLVHDNTAMAENAGKLMSLYKEGLIPKTCQDFELALSGYVGGATDELTVVSRLNAITDYELLYWKNFVDRQKAIARLETALGGPDNLPPPKSQ